VVEPSIRKKDGSKWEISEEGLGRKKYETGGLGSFAMESYLATCSSKGNFEADFPFSNIGYDPDHFAKIALNSHGIGYIHKSCELSCQITYPEA